MLTPEEDVEITSLKKRGWTISAIARHVGHDRIALIGRDEVAVLRNADLGALGARDHVPAQRWTGRFTRVHHLVEVVEAVATGSWRRALGSRAVALGRAAAAGLVGEPEVAPVPRDDGVVHELEPVTRGWVGIRDVRVRLAVGRGWVLRGGDVPDLPVARAGGHRDALLEEGLDVVARAP